MSVVPLLRLRPRPGNLREVAEKIEDATGLRVQILGGSLVMSPTPRGKHAGCHQAPAGAVGARNPEWARGLRGFFRGHAR